MVAFMILDVLVFVASEASDQYEMPFIFHPHIQWSSFKLNGGSGGGGVGGEEFGPLTNYTQTKTPIFMTFGM